MEGEAGLLTYPRFAALVGFMQIHGRSSMASRMLSKLLLFTAAMMGMSSATAQTLIFVTNSDINTVGAYTMAGATVNAALITGLPNLMSIVVSGTDLYVAQQGGAIVLAAQQDHGESHRHLSETSHDPIDQSDRSPRRSRG